MKTTMEIAQQLVAFCREGKDQECLDTLYTDTAVSVEAGAMPGMDREAKGKAAIRAKGQWWYSNHEMHSAKVTGPWPHDDRFIVGFEMDVTFKPTGQRTQMTEMGLYFVKDGLIVREEFYYDTSDM